VGRLLRVEEPDWEPLARLTEDDALILRQFMWMGCLRLTWKAGSIPRSVMRSSCWASSP